MNDEAFDEYPRNDFPERIVADFEEQVKK